MGAPGMSLLWLLALAPLAAGQFGGGNDFAQPPPNCPSFRCPSKQKPVRKEGVKVYASECPESSISFMDASGGPLSHRQGGPPYNKCCVEKDICHMTCGMTVAACHSTFHKCLKKSCKGDQSCVLGAQLADVGKDDKGCTPYNEGQKAACECVPADEWQSVTETRLASFYKSYNPSKLDKYGELKDTEAIWKQWKGKEPQMFFELTKKYKDKAVEIEKTKDSKKKGSATDDILKEENPKKRKAKEGAAGSAAEEAEPEQDTQDAEFAQKKKDLEARKEKAKEEEDFDLAQELKDELLTLKREELKRLKADKSAAIDAENFIKAKQIKRKIAALDPKDEL